MNGKAIIHSTASFRNWFPTDCSIDEHYFFFCFIFSSLASLPSQISSAIKLLNESVSINRISYSLTRANRFTKQRNQSQWGSRCLVNQLARLRIAGFDL